MFIILFIRHQPYNLNFKMKTVSGRCASVGSVEWDIIHMWNRMVRVQAREEKYDRLVETHTQ